eukprot:scaffold294494_cov41-Tisochrysis_lutea.AAC.3
MSMRPRTYVFCQQRKLREGVVEKEDGDVDSNSRKEEEKDQPEARDDQRCQHTEEADDPDIRFEGVVDGLQFRQDIQHSGQEESRIRLGEVVAHRAK